MTTYNFSALADEQEIAFLAGDVLHFDDPAISAADLTLDGTDDPPAFTGFTVAGKTVILDVAPLSLSSDEVTFADGSLLLIGGQGSDTQTGGNGDDFLFSAEGDDLLSGGAGGDTFLLAANNPGYGNETIVGGDGVDRVVFYTDDPGNIALHVDLEGGISTGGSAGISISLASIEQAIGDVHADTILGSSADNFLDGRDANDSLVGAGGNDSILGGEGNDSLQGNQGNDTLRGGLGDDELRGGQDADVIYSGQGADQVLGAFGDDELRGGVGADTISGGQGNDALFGGADNDFLQGRLGNDTVTGGAGEDIFWFNAAGAADADVIVDFQDGDLIALDAAFFTSQTFGVNILYDSGSGALSYDADGAGGGAALLIATLQGTPAITAGDISIM
jgi:Ca2+-binding RTX toxin-like protein